MTKDKVYQGVMNGAREVMHHKTQLNQINVFPVADGDTGTNLYSTMHSIITKSENKDNLKSTMASIADAAIEGARGNSGIIFAQFFQGISEGIHGDSFSPEELLLASNIAVKYAYDSVETPVEGTILTIMKVFSETIKEYKHENLLVALEKAYDKVRLAVEMTTNQLKVLKKSSVVDSGAKGFQMFLKGFIAGLKGQVVSDVEEKPIETFVHSHDEDITFRYCTEALIKDCHTDLKTLLSDLGDSMIVAGSDRKKRVHIHTDNPQEVFNRIGSHGIILEQKVDDMVMQANIVNNRKHNRIIITDSIADLPREIIDKEQVYMLPLSILIGEENYLDKLTIGNEKILSLAHLKPTSSLPSEKSIVNMINFLKTYYDELFIISVSSKLSGTYQVIKKVAKTDDRIHVIDSLQNSVAQGVLVHQCIDYLNKELKTEQILNLIKEDIEQSKILVSVDSIDPMIASGRLSVKAGSIVKKAGIKPIVTLKEGEGSIAGINFSRKAAIKSIINKVKKIKSFKKLAVAYIDDLETALMIKKDIESLGIPVDYVVETSAIIANGAGRGAVAVGYIKER